MLIQEEDGEIWKALFEILATHVLHNRFLYTDYFSQILHLDIIKSEINLKLRRIWFSMGVDYNNPYIHSTSVLCDK